MAKLSAGILLYRTNKGITEFFIVHPGGPFFAKKNEGWWTIPKGELLPDEEPLNAAVREFEEETGTIPQQPFTPLQPIVQKGGKKVMCWASYGTLDLLTITSNTFEIEWPPKSGEMRTFPEIDKAGWYSHEQAKLLINAMQVSFLDELLIKLSEGNI